jgi:signal transduction histidine kinase
MAPAPVIEVEEEAEEIGPIPLRPAIQRAILLLGLFQILVGAALLMVPHRFEGGPFSGWLDRPVTFGSLAVLAGGLLLWIRILPVRRRSIVLCGLALTALNFGAAFAMNADPADAHWLPFFGAATMTALALIGLLVRDREMLPNFGVGRSFSLAALMAQAASLATGVVMLGYPVAYAADLFDTLRPSLTILGSVLWFFGATMLAANWLDGRGAARVQAIGNTVLAVAWFVVGAQLAAEGSWFGLLTGATLALGALDQTPLQPRRLGWTPKGALAMNSARRRVILSAATASLATSLALTLALATYQDASLREQIEDEQARTAAGVAEQLSTYLTGLMGAVDITMDFVEVQSLDPALAAVPIRDVLNDVPAFSACAVMDNSGNEVYRSDGLAMTNRATDPAVKRAMGGALNAYGPIRINPSTGQPTMTMATALFSNAMRIQVGVIACDLPLTAIDGFVQSLAGADSKSFIVVGPDGFLISHPDAITLAQRDTFPRTDAVDLALSGANGTVVEESGTEPMLTGYATMPATWGWGVLVEEPEGVAVADIQTAREQTLVLLILAAVAVVALSVALAYVVLKPTADLVEPVTALGEGQWDVQLPRADDSELGSLIRAFGQMRQQLHEREAELVRRNDELSAARLKGQFLMTMTHELRSPMDGILGYGHLLLDGVDGDLSPEQAADVAQITASAETLLQLINNVLDFSLLESEEMHLTPVPTDVTAAIESIHSQFALAAAQKGLELVVDLQQTLPQVMVEEESTKKILANLVGNAVKFTEQGKITVSARVTGTTVEVSVTDTGIGIPPEAFDLIFEEFRQVDSSLNRRYGGAGLGLAIAKRMAEMQGIEITVVSQLGIGSTFTLILPRVSVQVMPVGPTDRSAVSPLSEVGRRLARLRVLQQAPPAVASTQSQPQQQPAAAPAEPAAAGSRAPENGRY